MHTVSVNKRGAMCFKSPTAGLNVHSQKEPRNLGKAFKLDIVMNTVNRSTRRKVCCWHSRLESEQMDLLKEQVTGCFDNFLVHQIDESKTYELNIRLTGKGSVVKLNT
jgi:hypothetical protein